MKKFILFMLISILVVGCADNRTMFATRHDLNTSSVVKNRKTVGVYKYKIKIHDRISVLFYGHPELSTRKIGAFQSDTTGILVNSSGYANFPLIGKIKVVGMYQEELTNYLEKKYAKYIINPQINIDILDKRIAVLGAVKKPGVVNITNGTMNLFEAIAWRGGISKIGKQDGVLIIRGSLHNPKITLINLTKLSSIRSKNLTLYPGNIVYVTPNINLLIEQGLTPSRILYLLLNSAVSLKTLNAF